MFIRTSLPALCKLRQTAGKASSKHMGTVKLIVFPSEFLILNTLYSVPGFQPEEKPTSLSKNRTTRGLSIKGMYSAKGTSWIFE